MVFVEGMASPNLCKENSRRSQRIPGENNNENSRNHQQ